MNDIEKREHVLLFDDQGHLICVHLHHMRYECIALSLGCSGFARTPSAPSCGHIFISYDFYEHRCTFNIITLRHCGEEVLRRPPRLNATRYRHRNPPLRSLSSWPQKHRGAHEVCLSFHLCHLLQQPKHRILNVFTSLSPPLLLSSFSVDHEPRQVLGA